VLLLPQSHPQKTHPGVLADLNLRIGSNHCQKQQCSSCLHRGYRSLCRLREGCVDQLQSADVEQSLWSSTLTGLPKTAFTCITSRFILYEGMTSPAEQRSCQQHPQGYVISVPLVTTLHGTFFVTIKRVQMLISSRCCLLGLSDVALQGSAQKLVTPVHDLLSGITDVSCWQAQLCKMSCPRNMLSCPLFHVCWVGLYSRHLVAGKRVTAVVMRPAKLSLYCRCQSLCTELLLKTKTARAALTSQHNH
jgi:hypothetical protein